MVKLCSMYGCKSRVVQGVPSDKSFHGFPTNPKLRRIWIRATKRKNFTPRASSFICSDHFTTEQYLGKTDPDRSTPRRYLKRDAIPFEFQPAAESLPLGADPEEESEPSAMKKQKFTTRRGVTEEASDPTNNADPDTTVDQEPTSVVKKNKFSMRHTKEAFETLAEYQETGFLCDTVLITKDKQLRAHGVLLCACSPFFQSAIEVLEDYKQKTAQAGAESAAGRMYYIDLQTMDSEIVEIALNFIYTGRLVLPRSYSREVTDLTQLFVALNELGLQPQKLNGCVITFQGSDEALDETGVGGTKVEADAASGVMDEDTSSTEKIEEVIVDPAMMQMLESDIDPMPVDGQSREEPEYVESKAAIMSENVRVFVPKSEIGNEDVKSSPSKASDAQSLSTNKGRNPPSMIGEIVYDFSTGHLNITPTAAGVADVEEKKPSAAQTPKGPFAASSAQLNKRCRSLARRAMRSWSFACKAQRLRYAKRKLAASGGIGTGESGGQAAKRRRVSAAAPAAADPILVKEEPVADDDMADSVDPNEYGGDLTGDFDLEPRKKRVKKIFLCGDCGKICPSKKHLSLHSLVHTGDHPHACPVCGRCFTYKQNMERHMQQHTGVKPHLCDLCGKSFIQRGSLHEHMVAHENNTNRTYTCAFCDATLNSAENLRGHLRGVHGENAVAMEMAGPQRKPFPCEFCGKRFFSDSTRRIHENHHHAGEAFAPGQHAAQIQSRVSSHMCEVCGHSFAFKNKLLRHQRIHTGAKPYQCDLCGDRFSHAHSLKKHSLMHSGVKAFACDLCPMAFKVRSDLKLHRARVHGFE